MDTVLGLAGEKTQMIPGHGKLANKAELQAHRDMIATVAARMSRCCTRPSRIGLMSPRPAPA